MTGRKVNGGLLLLVTLEGTGGGRGQGEPIFETKSGLGRLGCVPRDPVSILLGGGGGDRFLDRRICGEQGLRQGRFLLTVQINSWRREKQAQSGVIGEFGVMFQVGDRWRLVGRGGLGCPGVERRLTQPL